MLVENSAQSDHAVGELKVLEFVDLVQSGIALLLHIAVLCLE